MLSVCRSYNHSARNKISLLQREERANFVTKSRNKIFVIARAGNSSNIYSVRKLLHFKWKKVDFFFKGGPLILFCIHKFSPTTPQKPGKIVKVFLWSLRIRSVGPFSLSVMFLHFSPRFILLNIVSLFTWGHLFYFVVTHGKSKNHIQGKKWFSWNRIILLNGSLNRRSVHWIH